MPSAASTVKWQSWKPRAVCLGRGRYGFFRGRRGKSAGVKAMATILLIASVGFEAAL
jgi:hypothetical protein